MPFQAFAQTIPTISQSCLLPMCLGAVPCFLVELRVFIVLRGISGAWGMCQDEGLMVHMVPGLVSGLKQEGQGPGFAPCSSF